MSTAEEEKLVNEILERYPGDIEVYPIAKARVLELVRDVRKIRVDTLVYYVDWLCKYNVQHHFIKTWKDFVWIWQCRDGFIIDEYTMVIPKEFDLGRMYYAVETLAKIEKISCTEMVERLVDMSETDTRREKEGGRKMTFDGLIYSILLVLYGGLRYGKPIPSEMESIEQIEAETGVKIPPRYWDEAIRAIAKRGYAKGFEYDYETKRFFIYDASKLVLTYDGYEFMKQERFPDPDKELEAFKEKLYTD